MLPPKLLFKEETTLPKNKKWQSKAGKNVRKEFGQGVIFPRVWQATDWVGCILHICIKY